MLNNNYFFYFNFLFWLESEMHFLNIQWRFQNCDPGQMFYKFTNFWHLTASILFQSSS